MSTFLVSCQTTLDGSKGELVEWLEAEGHAVETVPDIEVVKIPWDRAYYSHDDHLIYVSHHWKGTDIEKALLLHELVHATQEPGECEALEREAYELMGKWWRDQGYETHRNQVEMGVVKSCDPMNWKKLNELR